MPLPIVVTLARLGGKAMDSDNLQGACKALRDAVAKLVGVDDADDRVKMAIPPETPIRRGECHDDNPAPLAKCIEAASITKQIHCNI